MAELSLAPNNEFTTTVDTPVKEDTFIIGMEANFLTERLSMCLLNKKWNFLCILLMMLGVEIMALLF